MSAQAKKKYESDRNLSRARQFAAGEFKAELEDLRKKLLVRLDKAVQDAEESSEKAKQQAEKTYKSFLTNKDRLAKEKCQEAEAKREADYQDAMKRFESANSVADYMNAKSLFTGLAPYKDSEKMVKRCDEEARRIEREAVEEAERKRKAEAEEAERQRLGRERAVKVAAAKKKRTVGVVLALAVAAVAAFLIYIIIIVPGNAYKNAEALLADGDNAHAAMAFYALGDYQDARERSFAIWDEITKRTMTISAGWTHTAALKEDGTVVCTQYTGASEHNHGQCDKASGWTDIVEISVGNVHTVGLKKDGSVVAAGLNNNGRCNISGWKNIVNVEAGNWHTVGLRDNGTVIAVGDNANGQCGVSNWTDIVAISANAYHTVGLKKDGTVVSTKYIGDSKNDYGQCNVYNWKDIVQVAAGYSHTVGLKADGTVVAVGDNNDGQCDVSTWSDIVEIAAGDYFTAGLRADGTVLAVGSNENGRCKVDSWKGIVAIAAGLRYSVGLREDGTVYSTTYTGNKQDYGLWISIGNPEKPENTQKGLQVKTVFDEEAKAYVSTLWADNITKKANGNYYCVIEDNNGLSLQSSTVEIRVK